MVRGGKVACDGCFRWTHSRHFGHMDAMVGHEHMRTSACVRSWCPRSPNQSCRGERTSGAKIEAASGVPLADQHPRSSGFEKASSTRGSPRRRRARPASRRLGKVEELRSASRARFWLRHAAAAMCFPSTLVPLHFLTRSPRAMLDGVWDSHDPGLCKAPSSSTGGAGVPE